MPSSVQSNCDAHDTIANGQVETNGATCHTAGLRVRSESSHMVQDDMNGKTLEKLVSFGSESSDTIFMGKECFRICNEQTTCSEIVSLFAIRQTGCRKPQYDREWSVKYCFNDRNHYGTIGEMIQNDRMITQQEISSELGLS
ncbi:uncharacterized protein TNCV_2549861 [Trichonephila clavipes]|nr:uncharacterized protein TNCV_2549861 [Trichonephila clavipes]